MENQNSKYCCKKVQVVWHASIVQQHINAMSQSAKTWKYVLGTNGLTD